MSSPSVAVSILAFHSLSSIERCIRSCLELEYAGAVDIIVREQGDDSEEADLLHTLARERLPAGRTLRVTSGPNLGFSAGHNLAIRQTERDLVLVLNADASLHPGFLAAATSVFADPLLGSLQGKVLLDDAAAIDTVGLLPLTSRSVRTRGHGSPDDGRFDRARDIFGPDGAAALFRRAALEDVGIPFAVFERDPRPGVEYFDESFFAYKEDVDLAWRLQWRGWRARYEPAAIAWHGRGVRTTADAGARRVFEDRMRMSAAARGLGFANQRLMQLKNDDRHALRRAAPRWVSREVAAWGVGLVTDPRLAKAAVRLARLAPLAMRKRKHILGRRAPEADPYQWFVRRPDDVDGPPSQVG